MDKAKGKDYTMWCWSCGKNTMAPDVHGSVCTSCGATYTQLPATGYGGKGVMTYNKQLTEYETKIGAR